MPERRLVDTSVLSLILKRDTRAVDYLPHLVGQIGVVSFITLSKLFRRQEEQDWGPQRRAELDPLVLKM